MGTQHTVRGKFSRWMGTVVIRVKSPPSTGGEEAAGLREIRPARYSVEMRCPSGYSDIFIPDRNASRSTSSLVLPRVAAPLVPRCRCGAGVVVSDVIGRREGSPGADQSPAFLSHATKPRANPPSHSDAAGRRTCSLWCHPSPRSRGCVVGKFACT
jgi:hypothetical protein